MVASRFEVAFKRARAQAQTSPAQAPVVGRRADEPAAAAQDAADLAEQADAVLHVLQNLAEPDEVELLRRERQFTVDEHELELRVARARSAQRLLRDVSSAHASPSCRERARERPVAATEVEHAFAPPEVIEQMRAPQREMLGFAARRHGLPDPLEVRDRASVAQLRRGPDARCAGVSRRRAGRAPRESS